MCDTCQAPSVMLIVSLTYWSLHSLAWSLAFSPPSTFGIRSVLLSLNVRKPIAQVIECNLRASRTFPFISKTLDCNFITLATRVMLGVKTAPYNISLLDIDYVAVKVCFRSVSCTCILPWVPI